MIEPGAGERAAWGLRQPERRVEGFVRGGVHASYVHTHWAGAPGAAARFVERCAGAGSGAVDGPDVSGSVAGGPVTGGPVTGGPVADGPGVEGPGA